MNLEDRINRIIHTKPFEDALNAIGMELFEFQSLWGSCGTFDRLPIPMQMVILYGEYHFDMGQYMESLARPRRLSNEQMKLADEAQADSIRRELIIFQTL